MRQPIHGHGVHLEDGGREILADNCFDLLSGIVRRIPVTVPKPTGQHGLTAVMPIASPE